MVRFPFQAMFQHFYTCAMQDIVEHVATEQYCSVEFEDLGTNRFKTVRIWRGDSLCNVFVCQSALPFTRLAGELGCLSQLLSVVSTKADIVACSGCVVDFVRTISHCTYFSRGVQCYHRFETMYLSTLKHKLQCVWPHRFLLGPESPDGFAWGLASRGLGPRIP